MLFNLTTRKFFKCIEHDLAIGCGKDLGPCFGYGQLVASEPFSGNNKCYSAVNRDGYKIQTDNEGINTLTSLKCDGSGISRFTISELEAWELIFEN